MNAFIRTAWLSGAVFLLPSGCSNINSSMSNITAETPHPALTNLTETLRCMGQKVNQTETGAVLLLVDDFFDGTVPVLSDSKILTGRYARENGPLADGGKYDFEAVIRRSISHKKIIIPYSPPLGLMQEDKFGRLDISYVRELAKKYGASVVLRVKGIYTQNDTADYVNKGHSSGAETRGSNGEADIEYGVARASRSLSLTIYLGDAVSNTVGAATTLTLNSYTESEKFSIGFGYGEGSMSFARQSRTKEGLHGAQRTLVEAAVLWALRGIYQQVDFSSCFASGGPSPEATVAAYQKWLELDEHERIKYLKIMLRELKYYNGKINKLYDAEFQQAVSTYEAGHDMLIPHTRNNLGDLFIQLHMQVDAGKIEKLARQNDGLL
ncbi:hypothetical protein [Candidatus Electronema sp. JC]|uniref:hypothetical protein n=1 Tax=Candidatus Electronema sp. JC TaxID=3401570 RepID=UPI003AA7F60C